MRRLLVSGLTFILLGFPFLAAPVVRQSRPDLVHLCGGAGDPEVVLTQIRDMAVHDAGILILDRTSGFLSLARNGDLLGSWGRSGQGPGEFQMAARVGVLGDSIWVVDPVLDRVTFFDFSGGVLGTSKAQSPQVDVGFRPGLPSAFLADGSIVSIPRYRIGDAYDQALRVPLLLLSSKGQADTLALIDTRAQWWRIPFLGSVISTASPFQTITTFDATANGEFLAWVVEGDGTVEIAVRSAVSQGMTTFTLRYDPRDLSRELREKIIHNRVDEIITELPADLKGLSRARLEAAANESFPTPDHLPPVTAIIVSAFGESLWLRREEGETEFVRWERFLTTGEKLTEVELPKHLTVFSAHADTLWGTIPDHLDVPVVVRVDAGG